MTIVEYAGEALGDLDQIAEDIDWGNLAIALNSIKSATERALARMEEFAE